MHATILSTYPPRACGLATFARDLRLGLGEAGIPCDVVASVRERDLPGRLPEVAAELRLDVRDDYAALAGALEADVVSVQHEFGILGGSEGRWVEDFMGAAPKPVVTTLHTVLPDPPAHYRRALLGVARASTRLVVMTETARDLLRDVYGVSPDRVDVIPHGTPTFGPPPAGLRERLGLEGRTVLLTFGLLGPSKGIEFALASLAPVVEAQPDVLYVVLGATHPEIVKREGEAYRERLEAEVEARGLGGHVRFVDRYVDGPELGEWLQAADVYVSPYPGMDQICSGTLANALAAGLPVVSTPYLHAAEVLAGDAGALVPYGDEAAFGAALARYAADADARAHASAAARTLGAPTAWPLTGAAYLATFEAAIADARSAAAAPRPDASFRVHPGALPAALDSLAELTDDVGPIQHTARGIPDRRHGYSADDAARALVVAYAATERLDRAPVELLRVAKTCLSFVLHAQRPDGTFHNFMSYGRRFLDDGASEDTTGRAVWGLGATVAWAPDEPSRRLAREVLDRSLGVRFTHARAMAYAIAGLDLALEREPAHGPTRDALRAHADDLLASYDAAAAPGWPWVCGEMTYSNALVPHALLRAADRLDDGRLDEIGRRTADFVLAQTLGADGFDAVGNRGWLTRHGERAVYDQQPVEAGYAAWFWSRSPARGTRDAARLAVEWFYGRNRAGASLFDEATGACFDGISEDGVNRNQGAESVLAGLLAHLAAVDLGLVAEPAAAGVREGASA